MLLNNIKEFKFDNGLKAICLKKSGAPIVSIQLWYKTGSINEHDGVRGVSHVLEHMMFRGSAKFKPEEHANLINTVGGHSNAFTAEDMTVYMNSVPCKSLEMVLELEADRMDTLRLESDIFQTEKKVIIEEYHTYMNNPLTKAFLEFRQEFFRGHPYEVSPLGKLQDLQSLTVEQCRDYYQKWYSPDNVVLVVVGDFDEGNIFELINRYFGEKKPSDGAGRVDLVRSGIRNMANRMSRRVEFDVPILIVGFPAPSSSHEDAVPMEILQQVLSGGESSRLHKAIVRKQSVAVMSGGINHMLKFAGMSLFFAAFTPDMAVSRVEKAVLEQIRKIKSEGITIAEMEKIKNSILTNRIFELYNVDNICQKIGYSECIEGDYRLWVRRLDALKTLDGSRLMDVAQAYWDDSKCHVLHLRPSKVNPLLYAVGLFRRLFGKFRRGN
jgi:zinc protease